MPEGNKCYGEKQRVRGVPGAEMLGGMGWIFNRVVKEGLTQKVIFEQDTVETGNEPGEYLGEDSKQGEQVQKALRLKQVMCTQ